MSQITILNRQGAYSATPYLYSAISAKDRPVYASSIKCESDREVPDEKKGGIIVFPQEEKEAKLSVDKLVNWLKDNNAQKDNLYSWTIGNFLVGLHFRKTGKVFSKDSFSIEIIGISDNDLIETGKELCIAFNQDSVLIKLYSERYQIIVYETT